MLRFSTSVMPALLLLACNSDEKPDSADGGFVPDLYCPGDPSGVCDSQDGAPLQAGAAALSIVPDCYEVWIDEDGNQDYDDEVDTLLDCGCDRLCAGDAGYPGADEGEGDGQLRAVWMAGFGTGRAAIGVRGAEQGLRGENDGLWARTLVLRQGDSTLAVVSLDLVGFFHSHVDATWALVQDAGLDIDHLLVSSTHNHEGPDTMGMWGRTFTTSGVDPVYLAQVQQTIVTSLSAALNELRPVTLTVGEVDTSTYSEKGVRNLVRDSRDPWVVDERLGAMRFTDEDGATVATVVSWGNHPEALSSSNPWITSDYAHALRETVESGVQWDSYSREGVGGVCVYLNAAVGGLMTPLSIEVTDPDGNGWSAASFEKADALGQLVGEMALDALESGEQAVDPQLAFRVASLDLPVENVGFHALMALGVFDRPTHGYDPEQQIDDDNLPLLASEVMALQVGPVSFITAPGELFPELGIGGYGGEHINAPGETLIGEDNTFPPQLDAAPEAPYLLDLLPGSYHWLIGLGNDEVGYIVPEYDFLLNEDVPYVLEAEGDHYEETNSLGPQTAGLLYNRAVELMAFES